MVEQPFTPYWLPLGRGQGPNSWVFFVVAQTAGRKRPLAVVTSTGGNAEEESLQGYPLTACCQRIVTIFADPTNHPAIRAEVALAAGYYVRDGNREYRPEPIELPDLRRRSIHPQRWRPWNRTRVCEFPFISTCLLQGVGFDAHTGRTARTLPEPLATVYRDTSPEWGMVVVDITELDAVRYGIVGFPVSQAKLISSLGMEGSPFLFGDGMGRPAYGPDQVLDDVRLRKAMLAANYMTKFGYEVPSYAYTSELLHRTPLVDTDAMCLVWPSELDEDVHLPPVTLPIQIEQTGKYQAITRVVQRAIDLDQYHFDLSYFAKELLSMPNARDLLRHSILRLFDRLSTSKSFGQLIRLAFADQKHLGLEQIDGLSAESISAALDGAEMGELTSISFCIDRVQSTPTQIVDVLSRFSTLRGIYLLQSPTQESDRLSVQLFEELVTQPQILSRAKVMLAGAYSSAMRQKIWLPTILKGSSTQLAPLEVFPVQQILVRFEVRCEGTRGETSTTHSYHCVSLSDGLLKPEHFAANFLLYIDTLDDMSADFFDPKAQLFSLSSGPGSFTNDPRSTAQVSPILTENFTLPLECPTSLYRGMFSPLVRDLALGGWTAIVSYETYEPRGASSEFSYHARYALTRARRQPITVDHPPPDLLGPEDLEVVGLKEFMAATAPEVDPAAIDRRLQELHQKHATSQQEPFLPPPHPLSVLNQEDAAQILLGSLKASRERKQAVCEVMETAEKWDSYPGYWKEKKT
ncbi:hypothetical protein F5X98DRAFT_336684 [Xylaria grammica]|nr:hypothetical protein F5X98DRAFT_336684 [Xylaria grammica]